MIQIQNAFSPRLRLYVVLEAVFGNAMKPDEVSSKSDYLKKLVSSPVMKVGDILYAFEVYYIVNPAAIGKYPMVLKELYESDLVGDKDLIQHYEQDSCDNPGFDACKKKVVDAKFLDWLKQDDEDSDSDSDDGSDVDVDDI